MSKNKIHISTRLMNLYILTKSLFKKPEFYVFLSIFIFLVTKYLLLTKLVSNTNDFLSSYKFTYSDSFDWIANGVGLFNNDSITFRSPGLVLMIKFLVNTGSLYLLPLINNLAFFVLILFVYKTSILNSSKKVALVVISFLALNYSFNLGVNYIMADIYFQLFVSASLYYLLTKKYFPSFVMLSASILFQNLGYILLILWIGFYIWLEFKSIVKQFSIRNSRFFIQRILILSAILSPIFLWNAYKFFKFGDPLYSKIDHFTYTTIHFDSVGFYLEKFVNIIGFIVIPTIIYLLAKVNSIRRNKQLLIILLCFGFNIVFWVLVYNWEDRRFLLYFIPFIYPLIAYFLNRVLLFNRVLFVLLLGLFYSSILPSTSSPGLNQPIIHDRFIVIQPTNKPNQLLLTLRKTDGFDNPLMNINPTLYYAINNHQKYVSSENNWYTHYSEYIDSNYKNQLNYVCTYEDTPIRSYLLNSILIINQNINIDELELRKCDENKP